MMFLLNMDVQDGESAESASQSIATCPLHDMTCANMKNVMGEGDRATGHASFQKRLYA